MSYSAFGVQHNISKMEDNKILAAGAIAGGSTVAATGGAINTWADDLGDSFNEKKKKKLPKRLLRTAKTSRSVQGGAGIAGLGAGYLGYRAVKDKVNKADDRERSPLARTEAAVGGAVFASGIGNRNPGILNEGYKRYQGHKYKKWQKGEGRLGGLTPEGKAVNPGNIDNTPQKGETTKRKIRTDRRTLTPEFKNMTQQQKKVVTDTIHAENEAIARAKHPKYDKYSREKKRKALKRAANKNPNQTTTKIKRTKTIRPAYEAKKKWTGVDQKFRHNTTRNIVRPKTTSRRMLTTGAVVGGGALLAHGLYRNAPKSEVKKAEKKRQMNRSDVAAATAGAAGSAYLYYDPPNTIESKIRHKKWDPKVAKSPRLQQIAHDHQVSQGVKYDTSKRPSRLKSPNSKDYKFVDVGDRKWINYNRSIPDALPGAKIRRGMSYTHAGKTGIAATGAVAAAGGYGAYKLKRKLEDK